MHTGNRLTALQSWLSETLAATFPKTTPQGAPQIRITPASQDASFRRYFRVYGADGKTFIAMDAPPDHEDSSGFINIAKRLDKAGLNVPEVLAADLEHGFLLLTDLGPTHYLSVLSRHASGDHADDAMVERLYGDAMAALLTIQSATPHSNLPPYDRELLNTEMMLFRDWFLVRHLAIWPTSTMERTLRESFDFLIQTAMEQPRVFVHRDYHSRNLMVQEGTGQGKNPGILDFQDAVCGPISYDLVSLLKDVYIHWPRERVAQWARNYWQSATERGLIQASEAVWLRWFDLMGAQRHLKVAGIFARLHHRDGKSAYLADIPLTLAYLLEVCERYPELTQLGKLVRRLSQSLFCCYKSRSDFCV